jgi:hypothetical protein
MCENFLAEQSNIGILKFLDSASVTVINTKLKISPNDHNQPSVTRGRANIVCMKYRQDPKKHKHPVKHMPKTNFGTEKLNRPCIAAHKGNQNENSYTNAAKRPVKDRKLHCKD